MEGVTSQAEGLIGDDFARDFAANIRDFAIEIADAGFVRVVADDVSHRFVGEFQIAFRQAGGFELLGNQEALRDLMLFLLGVAGDAQDFHAVLQAAAESCAARWRCRRT